MEQQNKSTDISNQEVTLTMEQRMTLMQYPMPQKNYMQMVMEKGASMEEALKEYERLEAAM